jgi:hypothetical protein
MFLAEPVLEATVIVQVEGFPYVIDPALPPVPQLTDNPEPGLNELQLAF